MRHLRWHYRSRHESLIDFSNHHFYDGRLIVFPSPSQRGPDYGVEYRHVEALYSEGGTNVVELQEVATAAVEFMHRHPDKSLGIVAMNKKQTELLQEELDRRLQDDDAAAEYRVRYEETLEPFFIKNLENVQGDERDAIFISTVYGPDKTGRVLQRFGPINGPTGHRRLNVLFTRAKEKVVLFSSMRSSDILESPTGHEGVKILRAYLEYADTERIETGTISGRAPDSDFEVAVAKRLAKEGYDVVAQVGVAGYFIDLAVKSPTNPDRFLLGIECDGATYHSAKSARDRDRLREDVLRRLGWDLYRIWSTDWYDDPDQATKKMLSYVGEAAEKEKRGRRSEEENEDESSTPAAPALRKEGSLPN